MANTIIRLQEELEEWKAKALDANKLDEMKKMLDAENDAKMAYKKQYEDMKQSYEQLQKDFEAKLKNAADSKELDQLKQMLDTTNKNL